MPVYFLISAERGTDRLSLISVWSPGLKIDLALLIFIKSAISPKERVLIKILFLVEFSKSMERETFAPLGILPKSRMLDERLDWLVID